MLSKENNDRLTLVGAGTPMGITMRKYWHPVVRSARLEADGAPVRVRLLGEDLVAFRSTDGRVGLFDEACPHRCASLALARNEDNGLRCIFHGWKFDVSGKVVDVPTEAPERREAFAAKVPLKHHRVREGGGIVWAYMGREETPPPFPDFEFMDLPEDQIDVRLGKVKVNWLQALESVIDSAHLSFLHKGVLVSRPTDDTEMSAGMRGGFAAVAESTAPRFEINERPYGFREGAIRDYPDGRRLAKIREFVAPYFSFLPGFPETPTRRILVIAVPIDDENCAQWILNYRVDAPFGPGEVEDFWKLANPDPDNFLDVGGDADNMWNQDRQSMKDGHFSGFPGRHFFEEDMIVQESMGRIVDRSKEYLGQSDKVITYVRRNLMNSVNSVEAGGEPWGMQDPGAFDYRHIRSCAVFLEPEEDWTTIDSFALEERKARLQSAK